MPAILIRTVPAVNDNTQSPMSGPNGNCAHMQLTYTGSPATFKAIVGLGSGNITVVGGNFSCTSSEYGAFAVRAQIATCAQ